MFIICFRYQTYKWQKTIFGDIKATMQEKAQGECIIPVKFQQNKYNNTTLKCIQFCLRIP